MVVNKLECDERRILGVYLTVEDNIRDICNKLNKSVEPKGITNAANIRLIFVKHSLSKLRNYAEFTLQQRKQKGYKVGLISDCSPDVPALWSKFILSKYFDNIAFSSTVKLRKPDKEIYELLCLELKVNPKECYYVGDGGSNELTGALSVGMIPILIRSKEDEEKNVFKQNAECWTGKRILNLKELINLIE